MIKANTFYKSDNGIVVFTTQEYYSSETFSGIVVKASRTSVYYHHLGQYETFNVKDFFECIVEFLSIN